MDKGKALIAALYAVAVVCVPLFDGGRVPRATEWVQIAIAAVTAFSVYLVPLVTGYAWIKSAVGATLAGLQVLVTVIDGGLSGNDVLVIAFAVAGALGIVLAPAASPRTGVRVGLGSDTQVRA